MCATNQLKAASPRLLQNANAAPLLADLQPALATAPPHKEVVTGMNDSHHWTYSEWLKHTVDKIVTVGLSAPQEHREHWFRIQIESAILQSLRHGRSGRSNDDPVVP